MTGQGHKHEFISEYQETLFCCEGDSALEHVFVESLSLEIFKTWLDIALSNAVVDPAWTGKVD